MNGAVLELKYSCLITPGFDCDAHQVIFLSKMAQESSESVLGDFLHSWINMPRAI